MRNIHAKCEALFNNRSTIAATEERAQQGANAGFYCFKLLGPLADLEPMPDQSITVCTCAILSLRLLAHVISKQTQF